MKVGLFYGSSTCYTEMAAEKIRDIFGAELVDLYNLKDVPVQRMADYTILNYPDSWHLHLGLRRDPGRLGGPLATALNPRPAR